MSIFEKLGNNPVIPVIVLDDVKTAVPVAEALVESGVTALEVTLRTPAALDVIETMVREVPDAIVGAGTVTTGVQFGQLINVGARFAVSPGLTENLAAAAEESGLPWLPGVATAGEIMRAMECGLTELKFFPAGVAGGPAAVKGFSSVFRDIRFCPTGGVTEANMGDYLSIPNVKAIGGSWLITDDDVRQGDWASVRSKAAAARKKADEILQA